MQRVNGAAPKLPKMTIAERQLWANSHNLPADVLLVYSEEMAALSQKAAIGQLLEDAARRLCFVTQTATPNEAIDRVVDMTTRLNAVHNLPNGSTCTVERALVLLQSKLEAEGKK